MLKILNVSDIHGSETCFRKFLNALDIYKVDVGILCGDLSGKMINPIVKQADGSFLTTLMGQNRRAETEEELKALEKDIALIGNYYFRTDQEEMAELRAEGKTIEGRIDERATKISLSAGKIDSLFEKLVTERLQHWMELAEQRLNGKDIDLFMTAGNDDLLAVDDVIDKSSVFVNSDLKKVFVKDHEMISLSWSNPTPWDTARECSEEELEEKIEGMASQVEDMSTAIFNFHIPPYDTLLDQAPKLSDKLVPSTDETIPAGSKAVLEAIKKYQPMVGLHGHIHESRGIVKMGETICLNPGSEYSEGILRGVLVMIKKNKLKDYMFVSG
jgi:Icc-related predicted phosphoesterase